MTFCFTFALAMSYVERRQSKIYTEKKVTQMERKKGSLKNTNYSQVLTPKLFNPTRLYCYTWIDLMGLLSDFDSVSCLFKIALGKKLVFKFVSSPIHILFPERVLFLFLSSLPFIFLATYCNKYFASEVRFIGCHIKYLFISIKLIPTNVRERDQLL